MVSVEFVLLIVDGAAIRSGRPGVFVPYPSLVPSIGMLQLVAQCKWISSLYGLDGL